MSTSKEPAAFASAQPSNEPDPLATDDIEALRKEAIRLQKKEKKHADTMEKSKATLDTWKKLAEKNKEKVDLLTSAITRTGQDGKFPLVKDYITWSAERLVVLEAMLAAESTPLPDDSKKPEATPGDKEELLGLRKALEQAVHDTKSQGEFPTATEFVKGLVAKYCKLDQEKDSAAKKAEVYKAQLDSATKEADGYRKELALYKPSDSEITSEVKPSQFNPEDVKYSIIWNQACGLLEEKDSAAKEAENFRSQLALYKPSDSEITSEVKPSHFNPEDVKYSIIWNQACELLEEKDSAVKELAQYKPTDSEIVSGTKPSNFPAEDVTYSKIWNEGYRLLEENNELKKQLEVEKSRAKSATEVQQTIERDLAGAKSSIEDLKLQVKAKDESAEPLKKQTEQLEAKLDAVQRTFDALVEQVKAHDLEDEEWGNAAVAATAAQSAPASQQLLALVKERQGLSNQLKDNNTQLYRIKLDLQDSNSKLRRARDELAQEVVTRQEMELDYQNQMDGAEGRISYLMAMNQEQLRALAAEKDEIIKKHLTSINNLYVIDTMSRHMPDYERLKRLEKSMNRKSAQLLKDEKEKYQKQAKQNALEAYGKALNRASARLQGSLTEIEDLKQQMQELTEYHERVRDELVTECHKSRTDAYNENVALRSKAKKQEKTIKYLEKFEPKKGKKNKPGLGTRLRKKWHAEWDGWFSEVDGTLDDVRPYFDDKTQSVLHAQVLVIKICQDYTRRLKSGEFMSDTKIHDITKEFGERMAEKKNTMEEEAPIVEEAPIDSGAEISAIPAQARFTLFTGILCIILGFLPIMLLGGLIYLEAPGLDRILSSIGSWVISLCHLCGVDSLIPGFGKVEEAVIETEALHPTTTIPLPPTRTLRLLWEAVGARVPRRG